MATPIDTTYQYFYEFNKPQDRTRARLQEMKNIGMQEVGHGQFGLPGKMSGLYIEMVWSYDEEQWNDYINWVKTFTA